VDVYLPLMGVGSGCIEIKTRNPEVAELIERKFRIKLKPIYSSFGLAVYTHTYSGSDKELRKLAGQIGSYMVELEKQGYLL